MAIILPDTTDGRVYFAARYNALANAVRTSTLYKATAANQMLISTGPGGLDNDNTRLITLPSTGTGVLTYNAATGQFGAQNFSFVNGVLQSDTGFFPNNRLDLHSWAFSNSPQIPFSALPSVGGLVLRQAVGGSANVLNNNRWLDTGTKFHFDDLDSEVLAFRDFVNHSSAIREIEFYLKTDFTSLSAQAVGGLSGGLRVGETFVGFTRSDRDGNRTLLVRSAGRIAGGGPPSGPRNGITIYNLREDASLEIPTATEDEARLGVETELRKWSPALVRVVAAANNEDGDARTAAATAQRGVDTLSGLITALRTDVDGKLTLADLDGLFESFALVASDTATIPPVRFANLSISENKLSREVQEKLNMRGGGTGTGIIEVVSDTTLSGDGTTDSPLRVTRPFDGNAVDQDARSGILRLNTAVGNAAETANRAESRVTTLSDELDTAETNIEQNKRRAENNQSAIRQEVTDRENADTSLGNRLTPVETKLRGIESGATADQTAAEIRDALGTLTGDDRLDASHIKDLPEGGGGDNAAPFATVLFEPAGIAGGSSEDDIPDEIAVHIGEKQTTRNLRSIAVTFIGAPRPVTGTSIADFNMHNSGIVYFTIPSAQKAGIASSIRPGDTSKRCTVTFTFTDGSTHAHNLDFGVNKSLFDVPTPPETDGDGLAFRYVGLGTEASPTEASSGTIVAAETDETAIAIILEDSQNDDQTPFWIPLVAIPTVASGGREFHAGRAGAEVDITIRRTAADNTLGFTVAGGNLKGAWYVSAAGSSAPDNSAQVAQNQSNIATNRSNLETETTNRETADTALGRRIDGIRQYPQSDQTKLAGIEANATADQTDAEIKTAYENNADTNVFSDADLAKLRAVDANATPPQTAIEIRDKLGTLTGTNRLSAEHIRNLPAGDLTGDIAPFASVLLDPGGIAGGSSESDIPDEIAVHIGEKQTEKSLRGISVTFIGAPRNVTGTSIGDFNMHNSGIVYFTIPNAQKAGIASSIRPGDTSKRCTVNFSFTDGTSHSHNIDFGVNKSLFDIGIDRLADAVAARLLPTGASKGQILSYDNAPIWQAAAAGGGFNPTLIWQNRERENILLQTTYQKLTLPSPKWPADKNWIFAQLSNVVGSNTNKNEQWVIFHNPRTDANYQTGGDGSQSQHAIGGEPNNGRGVHITIEDTTIAFSFEANGDILIARSSGTGKRVRVRLYSLD